jgi:hypothetical protein
MADHRFYEAVAVRVCVSNAAYRPMRSLTVPTGSISRLRTRSRMLF